MSEADEMSLSETDSLHLERPPVVEVALGIQFQPIGGLTGIPVGLYWDTRRSGFPRTEEHLPLPTKFEVFPAPRARGMRVELQVLDKPPVPRYWLLNERGTELIQIQPDRFMHNWRKLDDEDSYPGYMQVRDLFAREVEEFSGFLRGQSLGELKIDQCELTYVDHLVSGEVWSEHRDLGAVFRWWSNAPADDVGEAEEIQVHQKHVIRGPDGTSWGRLYTSIEPAWRPADNRPIFVFRQLARGMAEGASLGDALIFLDLAHQHIARSFLGSMTRRALESWGVKKHG